MVSGAMSGGRASDRMGRRKLFLISMSAIAVISLVSSFAWSPAIILLSQFLIGCAIGSEFPNSSAYVSDVMPDSSRDRMLVATIAAQAVGMMLGVALGYVVLSMDPQVEVWRYFFAIRFVVALLVLIGRYIALPESPLWLMNQGRNADAAVAMDSIVPGHQQQLQEMAADAGSLGMGTAKQQDRPKAGFGILFSGPYLRRTLLVSGAWFLMDISTYGVGQFAPSVLEKLSTGSSGGGVIAAEFSSIEGALLLDVFLLIGFLVGMYVVPKFGQIRMQSVGFLGMVAGMIILYFAMTQFSESGLKMPLVFTGFIVFNLLMNMGPNSTTFGLPALLFPEELRATAAGFAAACAKTGATLGLFFLPAISESVGLANTLLLLSGLSALAFLITATLGRGLLPGQRRLQLADSG
jgi:MFS family permease